LPFQVQILQDDKETEKARLPANGWLNARVKKQ